MSVVPGDPASLSACARTAQETGRGVGAEGAALTAAVGALADGWTGRTSAATRRSGRALGDAATRLAHELDHVGRVLQDQATDLADLVARERVVRERASAAGLDVRDGRVVLGWGVRGTADATGDQRLEATRAALQADLDLVAAQHARRRDFVLGVLRTSTATLAEVSHGLRRG